MGNILLSSMSAKLESLGELEVTKHHVFWTTQELSFWFQQNWLWARVTETPVLTHDSEQKKIIGQKQ